MLSRSALECWHWISVSTSTTGIGAGGGLCAHLPAAVSDQPSSAARQQRNTNRSPPLTPGVVLVELALHQSLATQYCRRAGRQAAAEGAAASKIEARRLHRHQQAVCTAFELTMPHCVALLLGTLARLPCLSCLHALACPAYMQHTCLPACPAIWHPPALGSKVSCSQRDCLRCRCCRPVTVART